MTSITSTPVIVARIAKAHGLRGEVVLELLSDVTGRIEETSDFLLMNRENIVRQLNVESFRILSGRYAVKFEGIDDRTGAEELRGNYLAVPDEEIGLLSADQFFIHDLVGMSVQLKNGKVIGIVRNVLKTGGVDLLEVGDQGEILIPFTSEICVDVSLEDRRITIDPPEGLLQLNAR
jgi:16S rRNA processing protein RimM